MHFLGSKYDRNAFHLKWLILVQIRLYFNRNVRQFTARTTTVTRINVLLAAEGGSIEPVATGLALHAKRGLAIACHLSVCPSACDVLTLVDCDHIGWNSSEIISRLVSMGGSLSADPNRSLLPGEHPVDLSVGDIRSQIAAEWLQNSATVRMESL